MSSTAVFRIATRSVRASSLFRAPYAARSRLQTVAPAAPIARFGGYSSNFSTTTKRSSGHEEETYEEFSARYEKEFDAVQDVFELQRNLNNAFAYDLVPSVEVLTAALKAARRVNDFPTAVRIFEGIRAKVENESQYKQYLEQLEGLRKELGVVLREELYPQN
ncbi:Cytochrome c oxidase subunit 6 [Paecilomyces lecythidis]|uniref:Cytochrome c oxidase subunit 6, mitochondrial n=1 Tax=Paecilomyces lecythidis TaxID=3004212 RepID=A0ABR3X3Z0_9EURO